MEDHYYGVGAPHTTVVVYVSSGSPSQAEAGGGVRFLRRLSIIEMELNRSLNIVFKLKFKSESVFEVDADTTETMPRCDWGFGITV